MNIVSIGERRVFFMVVNDGNGPIEVPIDEVTYNALGLLQNHAAVAASIRSPSAVVTGFPPTPQQQTSMAELMQQLDHGRPEEGPPQPLPEVPSDLKDKLRSLGFGDDPDPGELLGAAGDEVDGDQL